MRLSMLAIEASPLAVLPKMPVFRWLVHHVREAYVFLQPKDFDLDGSGKIQITCGPRGSDPQYVQVLGTSNYYVDEFGFSEYFSAAPLQRDLLAVSLIEESFVRIADIHKKPDSLKASIRKTGQALRDVDFALKICVPGLSRVLPGRKAKISVFRCLNRLDGEAWCIEVTEGDGLVLHTEWMTKRPNYLNLTDFYKRSEWSDRTLVLKNRLGKVVFEFDASRWE